MSELAAVLVVLSTAACSPPAVPLARGHAPDTTADSRGGDGPTPAQPAPLPAYSPGSVIVFRGMCDASGAIPIDAQRFAVADDEDNLIRFYDAERGGSPLAVRRIVGLQDNGREMDLEGATRVDDFGLWIGSHGRQPDGTRVNLVLSTAPRLDAPLRLVGTPYRALLSALAQAPKLKAFELGRASQIAPDVEGGLNIEGLTARPDGGVIIGFRSPVPEGRALIVGLKNPVEVARDGASPVFDSVHQLDLGERRGVRALAEWHGQYLVIGGSPTYTTASQLYTWDGNSSVARLLPVDLRAFNPEAFYTPAGRQLVLVLSDDGHVDYDGTLCKHLPDAGAKSFRGIWVAP